MYGKRLVFLGAQLCWPTWEGVQKSGLFECVTLVHSFNLLVVGIRFLIVQECVSEKQAVRRTQAKPRGKAYIHSTEAPSGLCQQRHARTVWGPMYTQTMSHL